MNDLYLPHKQNQIQNVQLHIIDPNSSQFQYVKNEFSRGLPNSKIISISEVYNKSLWSNYEKYRKQSGYKEVLAYHGTRLNHPSLIYTNGFLVSKTNAGLYFAQSSQTSDGFRHVSGQHFQMFLCRILYPSESSIYVIKNDDHHYPQYLITYIH